MKEEDEQESCPKCGSQDLLGLVSAFWISIQDGVPIGTEIGEAAESCTEVGEGRMCNACGHEWEE